VARDGDELVFVEVKAKSSAAFGRPEEMLTPHKRRQVARAAAAYLAAKNVADVPCRFDVAVVALEDGEPGEVEILRAAFTMDDVPGEKG
jgi:putative endonuclease